MDDCCLLFSMMPFAGTDRTGREFSTTTPRPPPGFNVKQRNLSLRVIADIIIRRNNAMHAVFDGVSPQQSKHCRSRLKSAVERKRKIEGVGGIYLYSFFQGRTGTELLLWYHSRSTSRKTYSYRVLVLLLVLLCFMRI